MPSSIIAAPASGRPVEIEEILTTLSRYNPETTTILQDYVATQCSTGTSDIMANLALLKLYQFNPQLSREDTIINILSKALTVFPDLDFSLCLHLLPPALLAKYNLSSLKTAPSADSEDQLTNSVHRLTYLNNLLESAEFTLFWRTLSSDVDEEYADLVADVVGFEDDIRRGIVRALYLSMTKIKTDIALGYFNFETEEQLKSWIAREMKGWEIMGDEVVLVDSNEASNVNATEAKQPSTSESKVKLEQLGRLIRRVYENDLRV
ncbi:armadillo-type protein [Dipodascopsis uninucleata]